MHFVTRLNLRFFTYTNGVKLHSLRTPYFFSEKSAFIFTEMAKKGWKLFCFKECKVSLLC